VCFESGTQVSTSRCAYVAATLALLAVLSVSYAILVFPPNEYLGFLLGPDPFRMMEAGLVVLVASLLTPLGARRPAAFMAQFLTVCAIIPNAAYFAMASQPRAPMYTIAASTLLCIAVARSRWSVRIPAPHHGVRMAVGGAVAATAAILAIAYVNHGPPSLEVSLYDVYDLRREAVDSGRTGYVTTWVSGVLNPLVLAYSLMHRKFLAVGASLAAQSMIFLYTGAKVALFQPLLVFGVYGLFLTNRPHLSLPLGLCAFSGSIFVVAAIDTWYAEVLTDFTIRRVLFVPAFLNFGYFDFFEDHPRVALTSSFLGQLAEYPYGTTTTGQLVADHLALRGSNATNGFLATGFMHFGIVGALAFGCIAGALMKLLDSFAGRVPAWLIIAIAIGPYRAMMTEADIPTALTTHGIAVALVFIWLISSGGGSTGPKDASN